MKVIAYITNCCNKLKPEDEVFGVKSSPNIFDIELSISTVSPEKSNIHYCIECYNVRVIDCCKRTIHRKNNEEAYQEKLKELTYVFKKSLFIIK